MGTSWIRPRVLYTQPSHFFFSSTLALLMNEERVAAGKCWIVAIIVLLLHVGPIYCTIVTLLKLNHTAIFGEQQTTESQQFSYAPYTATLWLGEHRTVNLLVDTSRDFFFCFHFSIRHVVIVTRCFSIVQLRHFPF